jgi:transporter family protein
LIGIGTFFIKVALKGGIGIPWFLTFTGGAVFLYGLTSVALFSPSEFRWGGALLGLGLGLCWASANVGMSYAVGHLKMPASIMAPLTNTNCLVTMGLSLWLLNEGASVSLPKLLGGTALILGGATLLSS